MANAQCLIEEVKLATAYRGECVRQIQANMEFIHERNHDSSNISEFLTGNCCAYNRWQNCIVKHLRDKCSEDAADVFPYLIHHVSANILKSFCPMHHFDPKNESVCKPELYQAPNDYIPKGYKSKSLISRYFSYLCPNVGWGIDSKRDF